MTLPEPIGFIGLGAMGGPMVRHLAGLGYPVLVHDKNADAVRTAADHGARPMPSVKAIADEAKLVFTCLPSLDALRSVVLGEDGLHRGGAVRTYVDLSTTGSNFAKEMAAGLSKSGVLMLDSPITGNVTTAGNGKLGIMCSGPRAAFDHAQAVMHVLASTAVVYLGEQTGKAQTLKLLNNLLSATGMAASCEAFIFGVKAGLDPAIMLEIINAGEASSSATRNKFPKSVLPRQFDFGARMTITAKDTSLTVKEAEDLGVPMWIGQSVQQIWKYAVSQGGADRDGTSLITFLEPWAGVEVRQKPAIQATSPAALKATPADRIVLLCEAAVAPLWARRFESLRWDVTRLDKETPENPAGSGRHCGIVSVEQGDAAGEIVASALRRWAATPQAVTVVNACPMERAAAMQLARSLTDNGHRYIDAVYTGTARDRDGHAKSLIVSGPREIFEANKALLDGLTGGAIYLAESPGAAQLMQQIDGALSATLLAVTCEAFVAGAKAGLDPLTMTKIMGIETGRNAASARILPEQVATRKFDHGKTIGDALRDLSRVCDEASRLGVTTWIIDKTRLLYGLAASLQRPQDDVTRLANLYEKWANVEVRLSEPSSEDSRKASAV